MNGSEIAKSGFDNEHDLVELFNMGDKKLLKNASNVLGEELQSKAVSAKKIPGSRKPDLELCIDDARKYGSVKKYRPGADYNHIARTSVEKFCNIFQLSQVAQIVLSIFTGEHRPADHLSYLKDENRDHGKRVVLFDIKEIFVSQLFEELSEKEGKIIDWAFSGNKEVDFFIFSEEGESGEKIHRFFPEELVLEFYKRGVVQMSPKGSIKIGNNITLQRKGGTGSPTNIQLKFKPSMFVNELFA